MQLAGRWIDGERAHVRLMIEIRPFGGNVKESLVGMNGQERGIRALRRQFGLADFPRRRLKTADIDSLAVASPGWQTVQDVRKAGVGAEIYEVLFRWYGRTPCTGNTKHRREGEQNETAY